MSDYVSNQVQGYWADPIDPIMSEYIGTGTLGEPLDLIDWMDWEASGWAGVEDDAAQITANGTVKDEHMALWAESNIDEPYADVHPFHLPYSFEDDIPGVWECSSVVVASNGIADGQQNLETTGALAVSGFQAGGKPALEQGATTNHYAVVEIMSQCNDAPCLPKSEIHSAQDGTADSSKQECCGTAKILKEGRQLQCSERTCTHKGTFRRPYELERHMRAKHRGGEMFPCPFLGCFKRARAPSFARSDKLTSHIRIVHGRQVERLAKCPAYQHCNAPPMTPDLLGVHIKQLHLKRGEGLPENLRGISIAASSARRRCPIWSCAKSCTLLTLPQHMLQHSREELKAFADELRSENYLVTQELCTQHLSHAEQQSGVTWCYCTPLSIRVLCPVCTLSFKDHNALTTHIDHENLIAGNQREHFRLWQHHITNRVYVRLYDNKGAYYKGVCNPWETWYFIDYTPWSTTVAKCPVCGHRVGSDRTDHHRMSMQADLEDIKPYRRQILKLYPEFSTHPVWDDVVYSVKQNPLSQAQRENYIQT